MASYELQGDGSKGVLSVRGECTIEHAVALKQAFSQAIEKYDEIDLDMTAVERADLTFLQLVQGLETQLAAQGKTMCASAGTPPVVAQLAEELGLMVGTVDQCFWKRG